MQPAHFWNDFNKQVCSFPVNQSTDNNNNNFRSTRAFQCWLEHGSVNSIRNNKNLFWCQTWPQHCVFLACVGDTDCLAHICQGKLHHLVHMNATNIPKTMKWMICEHNPVSHDPRIQKGIMAKCWESLMPMYYSNSFSNENCSYNW